jgi:hypothetical protein
MVEIEHQHAHRFTLPGMLREQLLRGGEKAASVERSGELIGEGGVALHAKGTLLGHHQNYEGGADDVEHAFERKHRNP